MVSKDEAALLILNARKQNQPVPEQLHTVLSLEDGYRTQQRVLAMHLEDGARQAGWKAGLTAQAVRDQFNSASAVFGYLLEETRRDSGYVFAYGDMTRPALESELCFTLGSDLQGPGVTPEQAAQAVEAIHPAFEVIELRVNMGEDLPLGVADNVMQWGWVTAEPVRPVPPGLDLATLRVEIIRNGKVEVDALGRDVIDNQYETLAWLANSLADYERKLEAGQMVLTGSFSKPIPIEQGDEWETIFHGLGHVKARFA